MLSWWRKPLIIPGPGEALPDRQDAIPITETHAVLGHPLTPPWPEGFAVAHFGLGCFWGAERRFWQLSGVRTTAAGYAGGQTANASYEDVCSGKTGHTEVVLVVWDPHQRTFSDLLRLFFEAHDPTQGMRQGNDVGTQYRSAIFCTTVAQLTEALAASQAYQAALANRGFSSITTEIALAGPFWYAEPYHQQYLAKNPGGYCGLQGTGVACTFEPPQSP